MNPEEARIASRATSPVPNRSRQDRRSLGLARAREKPARVVADREAKDQATEHVAEDNLRAERPRAGKADPVVKERSRAPEVPKAEGARAADSSPTMR